LLNNVKDSKSLHEFYNHLVDANHLVDSERLGSSLKNSNAENRSLLLEAKRIQKNFKKYYQRN
jgi:hypothetical protein